MERAPLAGVVGLDRAHLAELISRLSGRNATVACAESLTGGLLTALLTEVPGASSVVRGGLVVYATELKHRLAGVDAELLAQRGPVDPDVALALAQGVRQACGSVIGLGLTGVAGPDPQDGVAVGTWYVAMCWEGGHELVTGRPGAAPGRAEIRNAAVRAGVALLQNYAART